jgi:hypothetical protein
MKIAGEKNVVAPSYATVHAIVCALDPALTTLAQEGQAAFRNRYELIHRHRAEAPNTLWQADHTMLDILVVDANGKHARRPLRRWRGDESPDHGHRRRTRRPSRGSGGSFCQLYSRFCGGSTQS